MNFFKGLIVWLCVCFAVNFAYAHAPQGLELMFDPETKQLHVSFTHKVNDMDRHFIDEVKVEYNGEEIIEQKPSLQENKDGGTFIYKIPEAKVGDKIKVMMNCNKIGKRSEEIEIEAASE
jgi:hypothetical protein